MSDTSSVSELDVLKLIEKRIERGIALIWIICSLASLIMIIS